MTDLRAQLQASLGGIYILERELGGGGMSRVFVAQETSLGRKVVVKVMLPELAAGVSVDRFRREIQLLARLQHPHLVPVLSAGESQGLPYFTMPFIEGESLRARLAREGELPIPEAVRLFRDVASALSYAHGQRVIHRDIKPDNVLLSAGVAVVTDFGVAKALSVSGSVGQETGPSHGLTSMGLALGTPVYMAPEQGMADPATDHRADIYAFGVMAYEVLTGSPPFTGRSPQAVLAAHATEIPEPILRRRPAVPPALGTLVMCCLEKHPADRPQTATEIVHALDALATPTGGTAPTTAVRSRARAPGRGEARPVRRRTYTLVGVIALLGLVLYWWRPPERRPPPAPPSRDSQAPAEKPGAPPAPPATAEAPPTPTPFSGDQRVTGPVPRAVPIPPRDPRSSESDSVMLRLRAAALNARRRAVTAGAASSDLASGDSMLEAAGVLLSRGRRSEAAMQFSQATSAWAAAVLSSQTRATARPESPAPEPPPAEPAPAMAPSGPPPAPAAEAPAVASIPAPDPRAEIRVVVADYAKAIASQSIPGIRRVYPGLTPAQERDWEQFFKAVSDIRVSLEIAQLDVAGDKVEARLTGVYEYQNSSTHRTERQPVTFRAALRREAGVWRMTAIR